MYVQKNQEHLFDNWRYVVTTVFFEVPKQRHIQHASQGGGLTKAQIDNMEFFEKFMTKIIEDKFHISPYGHEEGEEDRLVNDNSLTDGIDL